MCVCVCARAREGERQKEREREGETERKRDRERDRNRDRDRESGDRNETPRSFPVNTKETWDMLTQSSVALIEGRVRTTVVPFPLCLEGNRREDASFPNKHNTQKTTENMQNVFTRILHFVVLSIFTHTKVLFCFEFQLLKPPPSWLALHQRRAELERENENDDERERVRDTQREIEVSKKQAN